MKLSQCRVVLLQSGEMMKATAMQATTTPIIDGVQSLYIYANVDPIGIRNTLYDYSRSRSQGGM